MKTDLGKKLDDLIGEKDVDKYVQVRMSKECKRDESFTVIEIDLAKPFALPVREFYTVEQSTHSVVRFLGAISTLNSIEHEMWEAVRKAQAAKENK